MLHPAQKKSLLWIGFSCAVVFVLMVLNMGTSSDAISFSVLNFLIVIFWAISVLGLLLRRYLSDMNEPVLDYWYGGLLLCLPLLWMVTPLPAVIVWDYRVNGGLTDPIFQGSTFWTLFLIVPGLVLFVLGLILCGLSVKKYKSKNEF